eukprot:gb/GECG01009773.1/.p1 GENE.gb/GECG01009773.1/~~gb/GECG01009773.1/.p1  ORF type:complete len:132 (+),score=23.30 gb/GECG01009773.1/:1-396(+)
MSNRSETTAPTQPESNVEEWEDYIVEIPEYEGRFEELIKVAREQTQLRTEGTEEEYDLDRLPMEVKNLHTECPVMTIGKMHLFGRFDTAVGSSLVLSTDPVKLEEAEKEDTIPVEALTRKKIIFSTKPQHL